MFVNVLRISYGLSKCTHQQIRAQICIYVLVQLRPQKCVQIYLHATKYKITCKSYVQIRACMSWKNVYVQMHRWHCAYYVPRYVGTT